jgi:hypothetical protein
MGLRTKEIVVGSFTQSRGSDFRTPYLLTSFKTRSVCEQCNNGWMGNLESWFDRCLGFLIEPIWPPLTEENISLLKTETTPLALWLIKTAIMVEQGSTVKNVVPKGLYADTRKGRLPSDVFIMFAHIGTPTLEVRIEKGFRILNGGQFHFNQIHRDGFSFGIQFNHLALRLVVCPNAYPSFLSEKTPFGLHTCIWLIPQRKDLAVMNYSFASLSDFYDRVEVHTWKNQGGSNNMP